MTKKIERIASLAEKQGIKASLKEGHLLSEEELRQLKIQTVPGPFRMLFAVLGIIATAVSNEYFVWGCTLQGVLFGILALILILFAIFGVRKTLGEILDSMDSVEALELVGKVAEGIFHAVGSVFDGL